MKHELFHILAKQFTKFGSLSCLPGPFCVAHEHKQDNYHNPNFIIFEGFRAKVMSKCRI